MSEELKPVQLPKAATLFNVGKDTIIETLNKRGFNVENKPTTKLSPEMMEVLFKEFKKEMNIKEEADHIVLGTRKKDAQDDVVTPIVNQEVAVEKEQDEIRIKTAVQSPTEKKVEKIPGETKFEKLEGPKVLGKIDLDKKPPIKEKEAIVPEPTPPPAPVEIPEVKVEIVAEKKPVEIVPEVPKSNEPEMIKTKYEKLEGPKVLGKIELKENKPDEKKKQEDSSAEGDAKRKRKRITKPGPSERIQVQADPRQRQDNRNAPQQRPGQPQNRPNKPFGPKPKSTEPSDAPVVSEKEIEDKIKETMARLATATGKSQRSKIKREKRREAAEEIAREAENQQDNILEVTEFVTVSELASMMGVSASDVIKTCMGLGVIVSINQRLDAEIIELVASEFQFEVKFISAADEEFEEEDDEDDPNDLVGRAPIVTIMGHVDHGKTSLLDYIRSANVASREAGGITQHIGAYDVTTTSGRKISFLDTPGHEAFTAMRARGAKLTDIAIIVIAADDQVMPQTKEAISHAQSANVPMIFAINKMDKPNANAEKIKEQLAGMNLLVEDWGGKYQCQEISAKAGTNIDLLLEKILLEAEIMELKANPAKRAHGSVIEASLDKGRGYVATLLVQAGTLNIGDIMACGPYFGKVKAMFNHIGVKQISAGPSVPVQILGLNGAPAAGEKFKIFETEQEAKSVAQRRAQLDREQGMRTKKHITLDEIGRRLALGTFKELNIIIKGDVDGSIEALTDSLLKLSSMEVQVNVLHKAVGQINETDVLLASASDAIVIGFQVRPSVQARKIAEAEGVEIRTYSVIYSAIEDVKSAIEGLLEPKIEEKIVGVIEVRETFKIPKIGTIAGCYVTEGKVSRNSKIRIVRDGIVMHTGELASLKRFKDDVKDVLTGFECGLNIKNYQDIQVGDMVEAFEEIEVQRKL